MAQDLSRFIDLSNPDSHGYPADIARYGLPVSPTIPEQTEYPGKDGPVRLETFEIGLVMAGAVSAGAYTAGVMDYMIEALDEWEAAKEANALAHGNDFSKWTVPPHAVRISVVAGASAGSVCSALMGIATKRRFKPVRATEGNIAGPDAPRTDNPFYDLWVNRLDIRKMLATGDISPEMKLGDLASALNSNCLAEAAAAALDASADPGDRKYPAVRRYFADPLPVALSVANLNGVNYCYRFEGLEGARFATTRHADAMRFLIYDQKVPPEKECEAPGGFRTITGIPTSDEARNPDASVWVRFSDAAIGSGAFPIAFKPMWLSKHPEDYNFDLRQRTSAGATLGPGWRQDSYLSAGYSTVVGSSISSFQTVDGGTMNNEPFQFARSVLTGPLGQLPSDGELARRALVIIDPFPSDAPEPGEVAPEDIGPPNLPGTMAKLFQALINQARYDANDLSLAADADSYNRFMLSPMRARAPQADGSAGTTALGKHAIASGAMSGFSGFLDKRYRHHDFLLGRRNAENFFRNYFSLLASNSLFKADWWEGSPPVETEQYTTITAPQEGTEPPERLILPSVHAKPLERNHPLRRSSDEQSRKLFVRSQLTELSPLWPGADPTHFQPHSIAHLVEGRIDALLKLGVKDYMPRWLHLLAALPRRWVTTRMAASFTAKLDQAIKDHGLDRADG